MNRILPFLLVLLPAGCGMRDAPEDLGPPGPDGTWQGNVAWIETQLVLSFSEDEVTGTGTITQNPIEGTWTSDDLTLHLSTTSNGSVDGEWEADWGAGTVGGLMSYPLVRMTLRLEGNPAAAARIDGMFQEDWHTFRGTLQRDGASTALQLQHSGALPLAEIEITGRREGDRISLLLGTSFQFVGDLSGGELAGTIEANNVASYTLFLRRVRGN